MTSGQGPSERRTYAAIVIQRNVRKYLTRLMMLEMLFDRGMKCLIKIQAFARGFLTRLHLSEEYNISKIRLNQYCEVLRDTSYDKKEWNGAWNRLQGRIGSREDKVLFWRQLHEVRRYCPKNTNTEAFIALKRSGGQICKAASLLRDKSIFRSIQNEIQRTNISIPQEYSIATKGSGYRKHVSDGRRKQRNCYSFQSPHQKHVEYYVTIPETYYQMINHLFYDSKKGNHGNNINLLQKSDKDNKLDQSNNDFINKLKGQIHLANDAAVNLEEISSSNSKQSPKAAIRAQNVVSAGNKNKGKGSQDKERSKTGKNAYSMDLAQSYYNIPARSTVDRFMDVPSNPLLDKTSTNMLRPKSRSKYSSRPKSQGVGANRTVTSNSPKYSPKATQTKSSSPKNRFTSSPKSVTSPKSGPNRGRTFSPKSRSPKGG